MVTSYKVQGFVDGFWRDVQLGSASEVVTFTKKDRADMWSTIKLSFPLFHWKKRQEVKIKRIRIVKVGETTRSME